jgi:Heavy metal associated domain 2
MIRDAVVSHSSPGRLRIKIASLKGEEKALAEWKEQLAQCPGVSSVDISPVTGSILLIHQTSIDAIAEYARRKELFLLQQARQIQGRGSGNLHQNITETFKGMDEKVRNLTDGDMNMGGLAFVVLVGAGVIQILNGNAGALPWYGAFWYAFNIFLKSKEPEK